MPRPCVPAVSVLVVWLMTRSRTCTFGMPSPTRRQCSTEPTPVTAVRATLPGSVALASTSTHTPLSLPTYRVPVRGSIAAFHVGMFGSGPASLPKIASGSNVPVRFVHDRPASVERQMRPPVAPGVRLTVTYTSSRFTGFTTMSVMVPPPGSGKPRSTYEVPRFFVIARLVPSET